MSRSPLSSRTSADAPLPGAATPHAERQRLQALRSDWRPRFLILALVWGLSFVLIKVGTQAFSPLTIALGRVATGAVLLLAVLALRRAGLPRTPRVWMHLAVTGLVINAVPFTLFGFAEQRIDSALAGIINATTPLFTVLFAVAALPEERPTRGRLTGLIVGFLGVLVVAGVWRGLSGDLAGSFMVLGATMGYGAGWVYQRRFLTGTGASSMGLAAGQLSMATVWLLLAVPVVGGLPTTFPVVPTLAVLTLGAFGTGLAFLLQFSVVRDAGATVGSTITYLVPVISTIAGVLLLHEQLRWNVPVGAVIVLLGAALAQNLLGLHGRLRRRG